MEEAFDRLPVDTQLSALSIRIEADSPPIHLPSFHLWLTKQKRLDFLSLQGNLQLTALNLTALSHLGSLNIDGVVSLESLSGLSFVPGLKVLQLRDLRRLTHIGHLDAAPALVCFSLQNTNLTADGIGNVTALKERGAICSNL